MQVRMTMTHRLFSVASKTWKASEDTSITSALLALALALALDVAAAEELRARTTEEAARMRSERAELGAALAAEAAARDDAERALRAAAAGGDAQLAGVSNSSDSES